ncbi:MAG TPA: GGDEF domain-containing protein [Polyangia bacterium]|nr:GGDEF domain-containing protein [Polyangia bacterium]
MLTGVLASAGLFVYALLQRRSFDPWEMFAMTVAGSMTTLGVAGWMIGRRDDALERRNEDLRALSERLQGLSATDALSGIANRRTFDERLAVEVARANRYGAPLSLVMIDLDHFKELNDTFGHPAGDEVLKRVAVLIDREKRLGDVVARYGGEEFAAILPHTEPRSAMIWAERVRLLIAGTEVRSEAGALNVTASFGVAGAAPDRAEPAGLIEEADQALYEAKRLGRNRVVGAGQGSRRTYAV